ncbi:uncharacterized protein LOC114245551 isoform X1 [Bombyx mandarina]|uniref:Uncharacterized protein n=2 Tax=Bombyx TaxID=7090 RepID=A0A8R1WP96_BOMMO|nr:uncharacterized protein LOC101746356 isoform X5 [Bombyx mori]XP_028033569.1 uncharacterized protein LOC114245551 isoform X1 [Bombyx mandarina]
MASSDPEIKDGFTLPVWMKTKPTKEFEPFAGSPPPPEDSFFYIRYPKSDILFGKPTNSQDALVNETKEVTAASAFNVVKEKDWSKHTKPCQDVLHGIAPINTAVNSVTKPKPAGTDDGFKGEGAACGTSVVKVAHQMISSRSPRGFTVASPSEDATAPDPQHYNLMARRGSKSLPATPAHSPHSSPTTRRKKNGNRYFTSPFEPTEDPSNRSWLSIALLGFKKELATSTSTLAEEDLLELRSQAGSLAESVESLGPAPKNKAPENPHQQHASPTKTKPNHSFLPKPSELREMNFWSPTSM